MLPSRRSSSPALSHLRRFPGVQDIRAYFGRTPAGPGGSSGGGKKPPAKPEKTLSQQKDAKKKGGKKQDDTEPIDLLSDDGDFQETSQYFSKSKSSSKDSSVKRGKSRSARIDSSSEDEGEVAEPVKAAERPKREAPDEAGRDDQGESPHSWKRPKIEEPEIIVDPAALLGKKKVDRSDKSMTSGSGKKAPVVAKAAKTREETVRSFAYYAHMRTPRKVTPKPAAEPTEEEFLFDGDDVDFEALEAAATKAISTKPSSSPKLGRGIPSSGSRLPWAKDGKSSPKEKVAVAVKSDVGAKEADQPEQGKLTRSSGKSTPMSKSSPVTEKEVKKPASAKKPTNSTDVDDEGEELTKKRKAKVDDAPEEEPPKKKFNYFAHKQKLEAGPRAPGSKEVPEGKEDCLK
ncbi:hypothetical protein BDK51DRAFT_32877, partial [Blyttiomyces helicus]